MTLNQAPATPAPGSRPLSLGERLNCPPVTRPAQITQASRPRLPRSLLLAPRAERAFCKQPPGAGTGRVQRPRPSRDFCGVGKMDEPARAFAGGPLSADARLRRSTAPSPTGSTEMKTSFFLPSILRKSGTASDN